MSARSRAGKAAWAARAATYHNDLANQIAEDSKARMEAWFGRGRIPVRARIMGRLAGRPLRLPDGEARR